MSEEFSIAPLSVQPAVSEEDVIKLARAAMDLSRRVDDGSSPPEGQQPGITVDLTHKNITRLPDEVIDIIKDEIERLAISHNRIVAFPPRLAECKRLRYFNVRYNALKEVPKPILQLTSLEILDLSRNRIRVLPETIGNLTSLKVLAISRNRVERLPLCIGDLPRLALLKFDDNPISFPPPEVYAPDSDMARRGNSQEEEAMATNKVKKFLRQQTARFGLRDRAQTESDIGSENDTAETPRPQPRGRGTNGRFPVKPSATNLDIAQLSTSPEWQMPTEADPMPRIPSQYDVNAPRIPPRSQHRYGPTSKSGPESRTTLLSPPDTRGPLTSIGNYQTNASSDSLSKGYRSASIITPRMANHSSALAPFSATSPATIKPPKTSYLIGKEGNIIGQFEQSDYANVEAARRLEAARQDRDRQAILTRHIIKAAFSCQISMLEQSRRLQFLRPSFDAQGAVPITDKLDDLVALINKHGERLSAIIGAYDHRDSPVMSPAQVKEFELGICNLMFTSGLLGKFFQQYMPDIWALGEEIMRMQFFSFVHGANEISIANSYLQKAYNLDEPIGRKVLMRNGEAATTSNALVRTTSRDIPPSQSVARQPGTSSSFKFPSSPPTLNTIGLPPGTNQKNLTSPSDVPNLFSSQEFVNAGANGKDELMFLQICKALTKMLTICVDESKLIGIREYYHSMTEVISADSHLGPRSEKARGFNRLAHGANDCYEKMQMLGSMMGSMEQRGPSGAKPEFWLLVRDAVTIWHKLVKELKSLAVSTNPEIKQQMKDIHSSIKTASSMIRNSPWGHYMTTDEVPTNNNTRGDINGRHDTLVRGEMGPPPGRDAMGSRDAVPHVKQSSIESVPTTPLGAALGPAAAAAIPSRGGGGGSRLNVFERADRYLANPGPFRKDRG
ncbi:hypothetical protein EJ08DRAFT_654477 [Tothia fuscella]|uniref:Disease resistance R13L4/SHOC-2-like LRR domain-containing protein n=1 Tax=Tothia fuscella TaxID=1048955 RepID=A0A9P4TRQ0_9PEZI|nr:hypothetical protein EJ08DRAFT_654477 [Tothia fuscella]